MSWQFLLFRDNHSCEVLTFTLKKSVEPTIWLCFQQGFSFGDEFTIHSCAQHAKHSQLRCAPRSSMFRRATRGTRSSPSRHSFWESQKTPPPPPFAQSRPSHRLVQHVAVLVGGLRSSTSPGHLRRVGLGLPNQSGHARAKKYQEYVSNKACFCAFCLIGRLGRFKNHDVQNVVTSSSRAYIPMNQLRMLQPPGTAKPTLGTNSIRHVWVVCTRVIIPAAP